MVEERSVVAVTKVEESDAAQERTEATLQGRRGRGVLWGQVARVLEQVVPQTSHSEQEATERNNGLDRCDQMIKGGNTSVYVQ